MPIGGGKTSGGPAAGTYLPTANATGATVDSTTYNDTIKGGGAKLTTLVFPGDQGAFAIAISGDAFPRYVFASDPHNDGIYMGNGTYNPVSSGVEMYLGGSHNLNLDTLDGAQVLLNNSALRVLASGEVYAAGRVIGGGGFGGNAILSGALPTVSLVSGTGVQLSATVNVEAHTPVTFNPGVATTATCTIALSPDDATYSTLAVETLPVGVAFDGTVRDIAVCVPATWYLKLTVNAQATLGTTTYY